MMVLFVNGSLVLPCHPAPQLYHLMKGDGCTGEGTAEPREYWGLLGYLPPLNYPLTNLLESQVAPNNEPLGPQSSPEPTERGPSSFMGHWLSR